MELTLLTAYQVDYHTCLRIWTHVIEIFDDVINASTKFNRQQVFFISSTFLTNNNVQIDDNIMVISRYAITLKKFLD